MTTPNTTSPKEATTIPESVKTTDGQSPQQVPVEADWPVATPAAKHDYKAETPKSNTKSHTGRSETIVLDWE